MKERSGYAEWTNLHTEKVNEQVSRNRKKKRERNDENVTINCEVGVQVCEVTVATVVYFKLVIHSGVWITSQ